jgi:predicted RNase H-like nuclease
VLGVLRRADDASYDQSLMLAVGIDACQGKWLAVVVEDGRFVTARRAQTAAELAATWPTADAIGVDIPIGLPNAPWRAADRAARDFIGERRSSVFPTFPALVLQAPTYEAAKMLCVEQGWSRPSIQSFGMRHRILEVARLAETDPRVFEVHPEVSFRELLGEELPPKRTAIGASVRRSALARVGVEMPDLPYPIEDLLDAAVAAWSASRFARGEARSLPEHHPERIGAIWR